MGAVASMGAVATPPSPRTATPLPPLRPLAPSPPPLPPAPPELQPPLARPPPKPAAKEDRPAARAGKHACEIHAAWYLMMKALRGTQPCTQTSRAWRPRQRTRASLPHTARSCWAALCRLKSSSHQGKSSQAQVKSSQVKGSSVQAPRAAPLRRQRAQRLPSRCEYSQPERRQRAQRLPSKRQGEVAVNVQSRCNPKAIHRQPRGNREAIERQSRGIGCTSQRA